LSGGDKQIFELRAGTKKFVVRRGMQWSAGSDYRVAAPDEA